MAISTGITPLNTPPGIKREVTPVPITKGVTLYDGRVRRIKTVEFVRKPDGSYDMPEIEFEIFLSDDGGKLLKMVEENKEWIQTVPNRVQIFIETDNDFFSKKVMKIIAGCPDYVTTDFDLRNVFDTFVPYSQEDIDSLLYSLLHEKETFRERFFNLFSKAVSGAASLTATMFDMVIHGIESLRISDKWWQIHANRLDEKEKGYTAKDFMELMDKSIETLLGKISGIEGFLGKRIKKYLGSFQLALQEVPKVIAGFQASIRKMLGTTAGMLIGQHFVRLCGLWNGIVDMVAGLVFIVKALVSGVKGVKDAAEAAASYRKRILEELDNIAKMFRSIQWAEVFDTLVEQIQQLPSISTVLSAVWTKTTGALGKGWDWLAGMSYLEFCYYHGYITACFIPFGYIANIIGKVPKIGQPLAKAFNFINDVMEKAFGFVMQKGQPIMKKFADMFTHIKNMFSKGTGEVKSVLKKIFEKLKELLDNFTGKVGQLSDVVIDNSVILVKWVSRVVEGKITQLYLVTYKKTGISLYCTIVPVEPFINFAKDILVFNVRKNIRKLAEEGFELLENKGIYSLKFESEIIELGDRVEAAKRLNKLLKASTTKEAKRDLIVFLEIQAKFVKSGSKAFKDLFRKEFEMIKAFTNTAEFMADAELRFVKKARKFSLQEYVKKHTQRIRNVDKGRKAEELFGKMFGGIKQSTAINVNGRRRYVDNILLDVAKEIKSGPIKYNKSFATQFKQDVEIVRKNFKGIEFYEWHCIENIDEDALKWAYNYAKEKGVSEKIKFIIY